MLNKYRIGVKPEENPNGGMPRAEDLLGSMHNIFFNYPVEGEGKSLMPLLNKGKQGFSYEYFYNGKELSFNTYIDDRYIDDLTSFFQGVYNVVNISSTKNFIKEDKEKIISNEYISEYTTLYFPGLSGEAIPHYKYLGNDFLQLILTNLIKNKDINIGYKVNFYPSNGDWKHGLKKYDKGLKNKKEGGFMNWNGKEGIQLGEFEGQTLQRLSEKIMTPMSYYVEVQIIAYSKDKSLKKDIIHMVKALDGRLNDLSMRIKSSNNKLDSFINNYLNNTISGKAFGNGSVMSTHELITIMHPPTELNMKTPNLGIDKFKKIPIAKELIGKKGVFVGDNQFGNKSFQFNMGEQERFRHLYIIGQTGTGKSVLTTQMALQDIYNGDGCCVIDPHGDLVEDILKNYPKSRIKDLVLFDPADSERPPGFNIMDLKDDMEASLFTNYFVGMIKKMYEKDEGSTGPHFEDYMSTAIWTLYRMKDIFTPTVADIGRFLTHDDFVTLGEKMLDPELDIDHIGYWKKHKERIEQGADYAQEIIPYITTKLNSFTKNLVLKNIVCQEKSTIDVEDIMNNKKVLLVKLSKGTIQEENMRMLGLLFVQKIAMSAFKRDKIDPKKRVPFYLYVDEFQNFITNEYAQILSEARKYKLGLTMAHQFISQLGDGKSEEVKNAVFGNVGSMVSFRIGGEDAEKMEGIFANKNIITKEDFSNIDNYNCYVKTIDTNSVAAITPFSIKTKYLKYPFDHDFETVEKIKNFSKKIYCGSKEAVAEHDKKFNELIS